MVRQERTREAHHTTKYLTVQDSTISKTKEGTGARLVLNGSLAVGPLSVLMETASLGRAISRTSVLRFFGDEQDAQYLTPSADQKKVALFYTLRML